MLRGEVWRGKKHSAASSRREEGQGPLSLLLLSALFKAEAGSLQLLKALAEEPRDGSEHEEGLPACALPFLTLGHSLGSGRKQWFSS